MLRKNLLFLVVLLAVVLMGCGEKQSADYDVCVYGGSSAGVMAAYSATLMGKKVILVHPEKHLGGLSASGLGATDIGNKHAVTGLSRDFYRRLGAHYGKLEAWTFEPHVAEKVFNDLISEADVEVIYHHQLEDVIKKGSEITSVQVKSTQDGKERNIKALRFIDATYVGDLLAAAGVSYTVGRESNDKYNESYNGVQLMDDNQFPPNKKESWHVDPYVEPGNPESGYCYGITNDSLQPEGTGDDRVQAYNYRLCLTKVDSNKVAFTKPEGYDPAHYELLRRLIVERDEQGWKQQLRHFYFRIIKMPNGKTDVNNKGPFSTDFIGMSYDYPEASYEQRDSIEKEHEKYIRGLLYFFSHDPEIPEAVRQEMSQWAWAADEFTDNDHFPHKMYIREARRMIGEYIMTEHHCVGDEVVPDPIASAAYQMDSHNCQRLAIKKDGKMMVKNEGDVQVGGFPPYPISYLSLTPKRKECQNLMVPVCMSASHIAYGSIRMEPVFMVLGQVAGVAAAMSIDNDQMVQEVDVDLLRTKLTEDPLLDGTPKDIVIDNADSNLVEVKGEWTLMDDWMEQYRESVLIADDPGSEASVRFELPVYKSGKYNVYLYVSEKPKDKSFDKDFSDAVKVKIHRDEDIQDLIINQEAHQNDWVPLGKYQLEKDKKAFVEIIAGKGDKPVVADAVLLVPETRRERNEE